jgi:hypothetical protein
MEPIGILGIVAIAIAILWGILGLCMPFMIYAIMRNADRIAKHAKAIDGYLYQMNQRGQ